MIFLSSHRELIKNLVVKDLKLKYRDSVLGFLWSLANPLLLILVYNFVFGHMLRGGPPNFAYFLMVGLLPWNFFAQSLTMSTGSIVENGGLIKKVAIPMEVFPVATVLFSLAQFLLALIVFFPMAIFFFDVKIGWSWITFVPILTLHFLFTLGLCFLFSTATVFYRDVRHFTEILLMLLFWLTPIIYDLNTVPKSLSAIVLLNPVSYFTLAYQDVLYRNIFPSPDRMITLILESIISLGAGYSIFAMYKLRFAEEV